MREIHARLPDAVAERVIFDFGLVGSLGLLHGRGVRGLRPGSRRADRWRRAVRRPARRVRPAAAGGRVRARPRAAPRRARGRGAPVVAELRIAVPRGALLSRHARSARSTRTRHRERCVPTTADSCSRMRGSSRCARPTCQPTSRPARPTSGSPVETSCSSNPSAPSRNCGIWRSGDASMVLASEAGEDRAADALRRLGVARIATKYPRIATEYFQATGRQAEIVEVEGLRRARAADGTRRRDRRSDGDRNDAPGEQPRDS